jgi:hypothetical protein
VDGTDYIATETVFGLDVTDTTPSRVYAVDAATGAERWHVDLGPGETSFSSPAKADGGVYVGVTAPDLGAVYGCWEPTDALLAGAFSGDSCQDAPGDTPEQHFMGTWSDGTPVAELRVTGDPGVSGTTSAPTR